MKNQVIEVLDKEHGKKVLQLFQKMGVDTRGYDGSATKVEGDAWRYYGVIDGQFDNYSHEYAIRHGAEIITLPEPEGEWKPKRGDKVLVWDIEGDETEAIFITEIEGVKYPVITVAYSYEGDFKDGKTFYIAGWSYMKPLPQVKEVTMQEIADKFGVSVEQLKIKK